MSTKSCGAVVVFGDKVLLVKDRSGDGRWGLPMGKQEMGESEEQAAIREIKEETDVDVVLIPGFREICLVGEKHMVFFKGKAQTSAVCAKKNEISVAEWMRSDELQNEEAYEGVKQLVAKAMR